MTRDRRHDPRDHAVGPFHRRYLFTVERDPRPADWRSAVAEEDVRLQGTPIESADWLPCALTLVRTGYRLEDGELIAGSHRRGDQARAKLEKCPNVTDKFTTAPAFFQSAEELERVAIPRRSRASAGEPRTGGTEGSLTIGRGFDMHDPLYLAIGRAPRLIGIQDKGAHPSLSG